MLGDYDLAWRYWHGGLGRPALASAGLKFPALWLISDCDWAAGEAHNQLADLAARFGTARPWRGGKGAPAASLATTTTTTAKQAHTQPLFQGAGPSYSLASHRKLARVSSRLPSHSRTANLVVCGARDAAAGR